MGKDSRFTGQQFFLKNKEADIASLTTAWFVLSDFHLRQSAIYSNVAEKVYFISL